MNHPSALATLYLALGVGVAAIAGASPPGAQWLARALVVLGLPLVVGGVA